MERQPINLAEKLSKLSKHWSPRIIVQMNDYHFKLVKFQGELVWHNHADTDEVFIVLEGAMTIHENLPLDTPPLAAGRKAGHRTG